MPLSLLKYDCRKHSARRCTGYRDELTASAPPVHQKSECRAQRDDGHARRHNESEFARRSNSYHHWEWFAPRIGRSPRRVPAVNAHSLRRSPGCKSPAVLLAMGPHFHGQATCSVRSIHIPEEAGSDAAGNALQLLHRHEKWTRQRQPPAYQKFHDCLFYSSCSTQATCRELIAAKTTVILSLSH